MKPRILFIVTVLVTMMISSSATAVVVSGHYFRPNDAASRAEVATMIWRAHGAPPTSIVHPFEDVPDDEYYSEAVSWCYAIGACQGSFVAGDPLPLHNFDAYPGVERAIYDASVEHGVSSYLMGEIVRCETEPDGNPLSLSFAGAMGLGQQMPEFWDGRSLLAIGFIGDPFNPVHNARVTAWLLARDGTRHWAPWSGSCSTAY